MENKAYVHTCAQRHMFKYTLAHKELHCALDFDHFVHFIVHQFLLLRQLRSKKAKG